jgi:hypothetical protein
MSDLELLCHCHLGLVTCRYRYKICRDKENRNEEV